MKISEFIEKLDKVKQEFGDVEVCVFDPDDLNEGGLKVVEAFICARENKEGNIESLTICDRETMLSFLE